MTQLVTRKEFAALCGLPPGTFSTHVLAYNKKAKLKGWPLLEPDEVKTEGTHFHHRNTKKFFFNPARVAEFKAALAKRKEK